MHAWPGCMAIMHDTCAAGPRRLRPDPPTAADGLPRAPAPLAGPPELLGWCWEGAWGELAGSAGPSASAAWLVAPGGSAPAGRGACPAACSAGAGSAADWTAACCTGSSCLAACCTGGSCAGATAGLMAWPPPLPCDTAPASAPPRPGPLLAGVAQAAAAAAAAAASAAAAPAPPSGLPCPPSRSQQLLLRSSSSSLVRLPGLNATCALDSRSSCSPAGSRQDATCSTSWQVATSDSRSRPPKPPASAPKPATPRRTSPVNSSDLRRLQLAASACSGVSGRW
jgi:hypothetical protein